VGYSGEEIPDLPTPPQSTGDSARPDAPASSQTRAARNLRSRPAASGYDAVHTPLGVLTGHTDWVNAMVFSPDGHTLASGSADRTVRLWG
jgi:WD40 repeat protein